MNQIKEDKTTIMIKSASFLIRVIILFTTVVVLVDFAQRYNQVVFSVIILMLLIAMIVEGIGNFIKRR